MVAHGDKMATTQADLSNSANPHLCPPPAPKRGKHGKPAATAKFGSASVPIYRCDSGGRIRYAISHYRDGKRLRQFFTTLEAAKKEGLFVAQRIQAGMQHVTDLKPHERDNYAKALQLLADSGIPLVAAIEDYTRARSLADGEPLSTVVGDYRRHFKPLTRRATLREVVDELLAARQQDGASRSYVSQLKTVLTRFADAFPGEILDLASSDVDAWLRGLDVSAGSRNSMLLCVKVLFSFARERNYLPAERMTAAEQIKKVKVKNDDVSVFTPKEMAKILHAAPPHLVPILAIGAFSGIRMAELNRLDWSAVDLERGHIELRASQAKTASRRIIPITDNLRAWIEPLPRKGKVVRTAPAAPRGDGTGPRSQAGMAPQRPAPLVHQLPHRQGEERRPSGPRSGQFAVYHLQALPGADHRATGGRVVRHHAESRPVGDHLSVGPPRTSRYPAGIRGMNTPFNPRANGDC